MEIYLRELDGIYEDIFPKASLLDLWQGIEKGEADALRIWLKDAFAAGSFGSLMNDLAVIRQILATALLSLLLSVLHQAGGNKTTELARWVIWLSLFSLAAGCLLSSMELARNAVDMIRDLLLVMLPVLFPLLAALGGVATVSLLSPLLLTAINLLMAMMHDVVFPLMWFSTILTLVGYLTPQFSVRDLAKLCRDAAIGTMGIVTTLFVAVLSFSGLNAASRDGFTIRAVKTAGSVFIPMVGRTVSDSLDSVLSTVLVMKTSIGLVGAVALLMICILPAIRLLAESLLFRLAGAILQPMGDPALAEALTGIGKSFTLFFAALAICGLFAFFALAFLVVMGTVAMNVR